jgi:hypothetical protein
MIPSPIPELGPWTLNVIGILARGASLDFQGGGGMEVFGSKKKKKP